MKYKIANKTDILRTRIAKEVFGEVDDGDGIRDIPSWEIFEKTLELNKQVDILLKALELACLEHKKFGYCCYADPECDKTVLTCEECCAEYFKDRAKEQVGLNL